MSQPSVSSCMTSHLGLLSWNVKGLNHHVKIKVFSHLKQLKAEIAYLQETHIRSEDNDYWLSGWLGWRFLTSAQAKAQGVSSFNPDYFRTFLLSHIMWSLTGLVDTWLSLGDYITDLYYLLMSNCWLDLVLDHSSANPRTVCRSAHFIQVFLSNDAIENTLRLYLSLYVHHTYSRIDFCYW